MPYQGVALVFALGIGIAAAAFFYFLSEQERLRVEQPYQNPGNCDNTPNNWTSSSQPSNGQTSRNRRRRRDGSRSGTAPICAICQESMQNTFKTLVCDHQFHFACINSWTQIRRECPICRRSI